MNCICGHKKAQHIYEEGACRPGFICETECRKFMPSLQPKEIQRPSKEALDKIKAHWAMMTENYKFEFFGYSALLAKYCADERRDRHMTFPIRCTEARELVGGELPTCCNSCHDDEDEGYSYLCGGGLDCFNGREWEICCILVEPISKWLKNRKDVTGLL